MEFKIIGFILLGIGILITFYGIKLIIETIIFNKKGLRANAKIIDYKITKSNNNGITQTNYYPIISFKDRKGKEVIQELNQGKTHKEYNDRIPILFIQNRETYKIIVDNNDFKIKFPLVIIAVGVFLLVIIITLLKDKQIL